MYWQRTVKQAANLKWYVISSVLLVIGGIVLGVGANSSNTIALIVGFVLLIIALMTSNVFFRKVTGAFEGMVHEFEETIEALKHDQDDDSKLT